MRRQKCQAGCIIGMLIVATGCGLSDYQEKMVHQQEILARLEKENSLLADPMSIANPTRKDAVPLDLFMRPPTSVPAYPDQELFKEVLAVYNGSGGINVLVATRHKKKNLEKEILETIPRTSEVAVGSFKTIPPPGGQPIQFRSLSFEAGEEEATKYRYYVYLTPRGEAAIIFQEQGAVGAAAKEARELSLSTFGMGKEAKRLADFYSAVKKPG